MLGSQTPSMCVPGVSSKAFSLTRATLSLLRVIRVIMVTVLGYY